MKCWVLAGLTWGMTVPAFGINMEGTVTIPVVNKCPSAVTLKLLKEKPCAADAPRSTCFETVSIQELAKPSLLNSRTRFVIAYDPAEIRGDYPLQDVLHPYSIEVTFKDPTRKPQLYHVIYGYSVGYRVEGMTISRYCMVSNASNFLIGMP